MSETKEETKETDKKAPLSLSRPGTLEIKKTVEGGQVRQSFSHGRSKVVAVEVRKKRTYALDSGGKMAEVTPVAEVLGALIAAPTDASTPEAGPAARTAGATLTTEEKAVPRPRPRGRPEGGGSSQARSPPSGRPRGRAEGGGSSQARSPGPRERSRR